MIKKRVSFMKDFEVGKINARRSRINDHRNFGGGGLLIVAVIG